MIDKRLRELMAKNRQLKRMLRLYEWTKIGTGFEYCRICRMERYTASGHSPDCELAELLK